MESGIDKEYCWRNKEIITIMSNYGREVLQITQVRKESIERCMNASSDEWKKFLAITLMYAAHHKSIPVEVRDHREFIITDGPAFSFLQEENIEPLFEELAVVKKGDAICGPVIQGNPDERSYSAYIHGGSLCFGISPKDKYLTEKCGEKIDVLLWGEPQKTWLRFSKKDIGHLVRGIYSNYCHDRHEMFDILGFFHKKYLKQKIIQ